MTILTVELVCYLANLQRTGAEIPMGSMHFVDGRVFNG
jgi:hypothetical protein